MGNNLTVLELSKYCVLHTYGLYTKLICSIVLRLTAFNKDIMSYLDKNCLRDYISIYEVEIQMPLS